MKQAHHYRRRRFMLAAGISSLASLMPTYAKPTSAVLPAELSSKLIGAANAQLTDDLSGVRLFNDVVKYVNFGEHRTGTKVDTETANWLAEAFMASGCDARLSAFTFRKFDFESADLSVGGEEIACFPLWHPLPTGAAPLQAALRLVDATPPAKTTPHIALISFKFDVRATITPRMPSARQINDAIQGGAIAIVAVTEGPSDEIIGLNAINLPRSWEVPVAVVAGRDKARLEKMAINGVTAKLRIVGKYIDDAKANNVIASRGTTGKTIVVSTPISGWFRCGGERGVGIAVMLGLARWLNQQKSTQRYLFVATSGHEFGGIGMKHYLKNDALDKKEVMAWLHLGAGFAVWDWQKVNGKLTRMNTIEKRRYLMSTAELAPIIAPAFSALDGMKPITDSSVGEIDLLLKAGYAAFGIVGAQQLHHTPIDLANNTAPEILEPIARALAQSLQAVEEKLQ